MTAGYGTPTPQTSPPDMISMRFTSTGALDTTYANNGIFRYDGQGAADRARDLTLMPDGRIFLAGATETLVTGVGAATNALAVVLKPNGTLDTSFGKGGVLQVDPGGTADWFYGTTLLPSGKVVAVGYKGGVPTSGDDASIARFDVGYVPAPVAAIAGIRHNATLKRGPSTLGGTVTPTTDVARVTVKLTRGTGAALPRLQPGQAVVLRDELRREQGLRRRLPAGQVDGLPRRRSAERQLHARGGRGVEARREAGRDERPEPDPLPVKTDARTDALPAAAGGHRCSRPRRPSSSCGGREQ